MSDKDTVKLYDGEKEINIFFKRSSAEVLKNARSVYSQVFSTCMREGCLVRKELERHLEERGIWTEEKEKQVEDLQEQVANLEKELAKGGIKLSEAREKAMDMRRLRIKIRDVAAERAIADSETCEGQAETARFEYLLTESAYDNDTGEKILKDWDEYTARSSEPFVIQLAQRYMAVMYELNDDFYRSLPENKFLAEFDFVDEDLRLVDKEGRLIDEDGRLVNELGLLVDDEGDIVDKEGTKIDLLTETFKVERKPFLSDDGEEIGVEKPKKKRGRPKKSAKSGV